MKKILLLFFLTIYSLGYSQDLKFGKDVFQAKFNIDAVTIKKDGATLNASGDASDYVEGNYNTVYLTYEMTNNLNLDGRGEFTGYVWAQNGENFLNVTLQGIWRKKGQVFEEESGSQRLVLSQGMRYHKDPLNGEFQAVTFDKYYIQIQDQKVQNKRRKISALSTSELFNDTAEDARAAVQWRLAFPLICIILTFVAVPLSAVNPRQGKFGKLLPALLIFLTYFLLLTSLRSGIEAAALPYYIGLWPVHVIALIFGISLLLKSRSSGLKLKAKLPKRRQVKGAA